MTYRILLIDHDPDKAQTMQRVLTDGGYDVVLASEAGEAMRTFEEVRPDLAVIEALLPDKPGAELCKEIRATAAGKATPIVLLLEADEDKQARARALDLHDCDLLIERAIERDELLRLCEQLLETRRAQAAASGEAVGEPEKATRKKSPAKNDPLVETDESEEVLDCGGLADALSQLDTIIDRQQPPEEVEAVAETDDDAQEAKTRRAEQAGDFSYIADEMSDATSLVSDSVSAEAEPPACSEKQSVPVPSAAAAYGNNDIESGQDISDHLDSLFSPQGPGEPTKAEEQVLSWTFDNGALPPGQAAPKPGAAPPAPDAAPPAGVSSDAPQQPEPTVEAAAPVPEFPDLEAIGDDLIPWIKEGDAQEEEAQPEPAATIAAKPAAEPAASPVAAAPTSQTASFARPRPQVQPAAAPDAQGTKKWWLVAACVAVVAIGGTFLILFRGGSKSGPTTAGMGPGGKPPAAEASLVAAVTPTGDPAESAGQPATILPGSQASLEPTIPPAEEPEPTSEAAAPSPVEPVKPAATVPAKPKPKPATPRAAKPKPVAEPRVAAAKPAASKPATPEPVASSPVATAVAPLEQPTPAPRKEPAQPAPRTVTPVAIPEPEPVAVLEPEPVEVAVLVPPPNREPAPAPAVKRVQPKPAPVEPVLTPLELLSRTEPAFPAKSLKRARGEGLVLKLLVNEKGRVSRVLVDQGTPHKDLEAAAVGAVLGWKYRPATEDGVAVKAWTTAEFIF